MAATLVLVLAIFATGCSPSQKMAGHLKRGDQYYEAGQYDRAEIEYLNVRRIDPTNRQAIVRLGLIYYEQGRAGAAYAYLLAARDAEPQNLEVRLKTGYLLLALNQTAEALAEASLVLEGNPKHTEAPLLLAETVSAQEEIGPVRRRLESLAQQTGQSAPIELALATLHFRQGDVAAAEAACQRALALEPESAAGHFLLGNLHWARNDLDGAEREFKLAANLSSPRSLRRMKYADFKIQTGDLAAAKRILEEITRQAHDFLPAWVRQAEIALAEKEYQPCAALLKEALARDPANYDAMLLMGRLRLAQENAAGAIEEFSRVLALYGRSPHAHYQLALAHLANDDMAKAFRSLTQAVALAPDFDQAVLLLARLHFKRSDHAAAVPSLVQLVARRPQDVQAHTLLAEAYRATGNLDEALAVCRRLEERVPRDPTSPLLRGAMLVQQNKREEARVAFEKVLSLAPGFLPALEQLVDLDIAAQQYATAFGRLRPEVARKADSSRLHFLLSKVFLAQRDGTQAEAAVLKAIELDPGYTAAQLLLARLYVESSQYEKALGWLEKILAGNPKELTALMWSGMAQMELKNYPAARSAYERLVAAEPNHGQALNNLAYLYSEEFGMLDQAHDAARRARQLLPDSPYAADTLGWILYQRGEYQRALDLLAESAPKLTTSPEPAYHLGMACYMVGDERRAEASLKSALAMNKDFRGKTEAEHRLALLALDGSNAAPEMVQLLEQRLQEQPGDPVALVRLEARYESQGTPELAVKALERALKDNPANVPALIRLAWLYRRLNNPSKAMETAREAYRLSPGNAEVARLLGPLALEAGDHKWALSLLEQGIRTGSPDPEWRYDLARAYYSVGRVTDAQAAMRKVLESGPAFSHAQEARQFLSLVELAANPSALAGSAVNVGQILQADPRNVPARMVVGRAAEHRRDIEAARSAYEQVLRVYPDFAPAQKRLAILYLEAPTDDTKAYQLALQARSALPDDPEVARALGIALYRRGDFRGATVYLDESAHKAEDGRTLYYLGMASYQLKDAEKSKSSLQRALTLQTTAEWAESAKRVLAELK